MVKFKCQFSWQAKFGMVAGGRNVAFLHRILVTSAKGNLGCAAGCGLTGSCSDHGWISLRFWGIIFLWQAQDLVTLDNDTSCIVNKVSCVKRINDESHLLWQEQYLVTLELLRAL